MRSATSPPVAAGQQPTSHEDHPAVERSDLQSNYRFIPGAPSVPSDRQNTEPWNRQASRVPAVSATSDLSHVRHAGHCRRLEVSMFHHTCTRGAWFRMLPSPACVADASRMCGWDAAAMASAPASSAVQRKRGSRDMMTASNTTRCCTGQSSCSRGEPGRADFSSCRSGRVRFGSGSTLSHFLEEVVEHPGIIRFPL